VKALFAAGAVGLVLATRGTFAAEVAGCQVEIGAAGAMSSAAVVEAAGGSVRQALDAAAISFQNTMGSPCDLVQGMVEIPCHTRNAVAASSAFVCADLILGGYSNPVPLDETIDAVMNVGRMLPRELHCPRGAGDDTIGARIEKVKIVQGSILRAQGSCGGRITAYNLRAHATGSWCGRSDSHTDLLVKVGYKPG
jgi:L-serine dehydratase